MYTEKTVTTFPDIPETSPARQWAYFDIETLGLNRSKHPILVIGIGEFEQDQFVLNQFILETLSDEETLIRHFLKNYPSTKPMVTFNGISFDGPYCNYRFLQYKYSERIPSSQLIDTLKWAKRTFPNLPSYKLKSVETSLGIHREDEISGKECVELFETYLSSPNAELLNLILLHNRDDILNMVPLAHRLSVANPEIAFNCSWSIEHSRVQYWFQKGFKSGNTLFISLESSNSDIPLKPFYGSTFSLEIQGNSLHFQMPLINLKYPYEDSYYLVPKEVLGFEEIDFNGLPVESRLALNLWGNDMLQTENLKNVLKTVFAAIHNPI